MKIIFLLKNNEKCGEVPIGSPGPDLGEAPGPELGVVPMDPPGADLGSVGVTPSFRLIARLTVVVASAGVNPSLRLNERHVEAQAQASALVK